MAKQKLIVTIKAEMEVPANWEIVKVADGLKVLKVGKGKYLDFASQPMFSDTPDTSWSSGNDDATINRILDMIHTEDVKYKIVKK